MLKVQHLTKAFAGIKAIDDCSFDIETNRITALIGPNGSGKTTIFNLISGIMKPDSGGIFFQTVNLANHTVNQIANLGLARLFQQPRLFKNLTVGENLSLALDNENTKFWKNLTGFNRITTEQEQVIRRILATFGLTATENILARDLSFGQKRLVELARTILKPHRLLLLDEPVGGVYPQTKMVITRYLRKLKTQGETILLTEHYMPFVFDVADYILVIDAGRIIARGSPAAVRGNPVVQKIYLGE